MPRGKARAPRGISDPSGTDEQALRSAVVDALAMNARGINRGKSGNVSARCRTDGSKASP
jgi:hypothetical protein